MPVSEQGVSAEHPTRYMLVPRTLIFVTRGEKHLLLRGAANKRLWAGMLNGIGGHVEPGEDLLSAARRELAEETGLNQPQLRLAGVMLVDTGASPGVGVFVFSGEAGPGDLIPGSEGELEWLRRTDLVGQAVVPDLPILLERLEASGEVFNAHAWYDEQGRQRIEFVT